MMSRIICRWNLVRNSFQKCQTLHQSAIIMDKAKFYEETLTLPSRAMKEDDSFIDTIRSSTNSYELLHVISKNVKTFSPDQTLAALNTLFELQKNKKTSINRGDIVRNSDFEKLCRSLKRNARYMELNDVIGALKIMAFIGTDPSSEISMSLLHLIKTQINDCTLGHITFLSFLLRRMKPNPLVEALHIALPVLLQLQIGTKIDYENKTQLTELLRFVTQYKVSEQCVMNIVNALVLHGQELNLDEARAVIWSLSHPKFRVHNPNCDKLINNAIEVIKRDIDKEEFSTACTTIENMVDKYIQNTSKFERFYDETLCNKFADFVVKNDLGFENATYIQRHFNKLTFHNLNLLQYMVKEIKKYPALITECKPISLLSFVCALSQSNYKPDNWNEIEDLILKSRLLNDKHIRVTLPWAKLSNELLSLGTECPSIWNQIFNDEFIKLHLARDKDRRLLQLLALDQNIQVLTDHKINHVDSKFLDEAKKLVFSRTTLPLQPYIESAFGGASYVYSKVRTQLGHQLDHVIAFNKNTMEPVPIADGCNHDVDYEDITSDVTNEYIAVVSLPAHFYCINIPILRGVYSLRLRTFEKMGITAVAINLAEWSNLLEHEQMLYIKREVNLKLSQNLGPSGKSS